jgi:hypothetical protein
MYTQHHSNHGQRRGMASRLALDEMNIQREPRVAPCETKKEG